MKYVIRMKHPLLVIISANNKVFCNLLVGTIFEEFQMHVAY